MALITKISLMTFYRIFKIYNKKIIIIMTAYPNEANKKKILKIEINLDISR